MDSVTFKDLLESFLEHLQIEDKSALSKVITIDDAINLLSSPHTANGLARKTLQKAIGFVGQLTDVRDCWKHADALKIMTEPLLRDLREVLEARAGKMISSIYCEKPEQIENVPEWFTDLLLNPKAIPLGYRKVFCAKAAKILEHLGNIHHSDEPVSRICEGRTNEDLARRAKRDSDKLEESQSVDPKLLKAAIDI